MVTLLPRVLHASSPGRDSNSPPPPSPGEGGALSIWPQEPMRNGMQRAYARALGTSGCYSLLTCMFGPACARVRQKHGHGTPRTTICGSEDLHPTRPQSLWLSVVSSFPACPRQPPNGEACIPNSTVLKHPLEHATGSPISCSSVSCAFFRPFLHFEARTCMPTLEIHMPARLTIGWLTRQCA